MKWNLFLTFLIVPLFASTTIRLKAASPNGSSLVFVWKSDILSTAIPNSDSTKLYTLMHKQNGAFILIIDVTDPCAITSSTVEIYPNVDSFAGILGEDTGFSTDLCVFSLKGDSAVISNRKTNNSEIALSGSLKNSVILIDNTTISVYLYKDGEKLMKISEVKSNLKSTLISKSLIVNSKRDTLLYAITIKNKEYYLSVVDYWSGTTKHEILLPESFMYSISTQILLSPSEDYIAVHSEYQVFVYQVTIQGIGLIGNITMQLSAVSALPMENALVGKSGQTNEVYLISMEKASITHKMKISENDYLSHIYVRPYNGKTTLVFTDYMNWYAYELEEVEQLNVESLVNTYVILMSILLSIAMIIAIIYIIYSRKPESENPPSQNPNQNESRVQIPVPRTLDTHIITDLNETNVGVVGSNADLAIKKLLICPLTGLMMKEPAVASDGYTYEKEAIEQWFKQNSISPVTHEEVPNKGLIKNKAVANFLASGR